MKLKKVLIYTFTLLTALFILFSVECEAGRPKGSKNKNHSNPACVYCGVHHRAGTVCSKAPKYSSSSKSENTKPIATSTSNKTEKLQKLISDFANKGYDEQRVKKEFGNGLEFKEANLDTLTAIYFKLIKRK